MTRDGGVPRARRRPLLTALALALALATALAVAEAALRLAGRAPAQTGYRLDAALGWVPEYDFLARAREEAERVVFVGDSFTQPPDGFVRRFEERFTGCRPPVQAVNLGVAGYGTAQEYLMWREHGAGYRPHLVVLTMFLWNDMADNLNDIYYSALLNDNRPSYRVAAGSLVPVPPRRRGLRDALADVSHLVRFADEARFLTIGKVRGLRPYWQIEQFRDFYVAEPGERAARAWEVTDRLVLALARDVRERGAVFLLAALDNAFTVSPAHREALGRRYGERFDGLRLDAPMERLKRVAAEAGIAVLDLTAVLQEHADAHPGDELYLPGLAGHLTSTGERVVGKAIAARARELGAVSCEEATTGSAPSPAD